MEEESTDSVKDENTRPTRLFILLTIFVTIGSSLIYGWHLSVLNNSVKAVEKLINQSLSSHYKHNVTVETLTSCKTALSAVYVGGGMLGTFAIGFLSRRFGRRKPMFLLSVGGIIGTILMVISEPINSFESLLIGRIIMGIHGGVYMGLAPMYVAECASTSFRGAATTFVTFGITFGILLASALALESVLGKFEYLWILFGIPLIPIIAHVIGMWWCPPSPKYLAEKHKTEEASTALMRLRNASMSKIKPEMENILKEVTNINSDTKRITAKDLIKKPRWRRMLIAASVIAMGQQLCGVNGIIFYSTQTFINSGIDVNYASYGTLGISFALFTGSVIGIFLIDRLGRKPLLLLAFFTMSITCIALVPLLKFSNNMACSIIAIIANMLFMVTFQIGPGAIAWSLPPEMFVQEARSVAVGITSGLNWLCNLLVVISFPLLQKAIAEYTFLVFGLINVALFIFTLLKVHETKNKSPVEIEELYA